MKRAAEPGTASQSPRKILVATDFSHGAAAALDVAAELAALCGSKIDLIHVWQSPGFLPPGVAVGVADGSQQPLMGLIRDNAKRALRETADRAKASGVRIGKLFLEEGDPAHTIVNVAQREHHDLIALGTAGRTGLLQVLIGSVAEKVTRVAPIPVLTARAETTDR